MSVLTLLAMILFYKACEAKKDKYIAKEMIAEMPVVVIDTVVVTETMTKTTSNTIK